MPSLISFLTIISEIIQFNLKLSYTIAVFDVICSRSPRGVKARILDCGLEVSVFELHSCYYPRERYEPSIYGLNSIIAVLLQRLLWH